MIIAMSLVRMVQPPVHQIVGVVTVRHRLVAAVRTVLVVGLVPAVVLAVRAVGGITGANLQAVFFYHVAFAGRMVQVAVVQVVHMVAVLDGSVAAVGTVFVIMVVMGSKWLLTHDGMRNEG